MPKSRGTIDIQCPVCEDTFELEVEAFVDPGRMGWDGNGAWPPEKDVWLAGEPPTGCPDCGANFEDCMGKIETMIQEELDSFFDRQDEF